MGIEHASNEAIRRALQSVKQEVEEYISEITWEDLVTAGLIGGDKASSRRDRLGKLLKKLVVRMEKQLYKRITVFQISKEAFCSCVSPSATGGKKE
ncbi:hypothetical protein GCM10020331_019050 [Ectobacillus funiculus]